MAQIRICDRCKNKIDEDHEWFRLKLDGVVFTNTPTNVKKHFDLCPDCYNDILVPIEHGDTCIHFVDERKEI